LFSLSLKIFLGIDRLRSVELAVSETGSIQIGFQKIAAMENCIIELCIRQVGAVKIGSS
jgi:hypothetical protein